MLCAFYLNELLLKLVPREDPHPQLYAEYESTLAALAGGGAPAPILRRFELRLLAELGYALELSHDTDTGAAIEPATRYHYAFDRGPRRTPPAPGVRWPVVRGATLLALATANFPDAETAAEAKQLMREVLDHHLEQRRIFSRRIVQDLRSLEEHDER